MAIPEELDKLIEKEVTELTKNDFLRSGMGYNDFTREFTDLIGQAREDKDDLEAAGLIWDVVEKGSACLEKLSIAHGERVASEGIMAEVEEKFKELMPTAEEARKKIMVVLRYIVVRTQDSNVKRSYKMIQKGYGDMDTLQDVLAGVSLIKSHMEYLPQCRPGGEEITPDYLEESKKLALELVTMRGDVTAAADESSVHVERQNRLITLCIKVQREIKLFALIAYYDDQDRYDRYYASDRRREQKDKNDQNNDETQDESQTQEHISA